MMICEWEEHRKESNRNIRNIQNNLLVHTSIDKLTVGIHHVGINYPILESPPPKSFLLQTHFEHKTFFKMASLGKA